MSKWGRFIGISGTLIIHLSLLLQFIVIPSTKKPLSGGATGGKEIVVTLLPPTQHKSIILPPDESPIKVLSHIDPDICANKDNSYMGVGFRYSPFTNLVIDVPEYYPAYKAGIRVGDLLLDPDSPIVDGYLNIEIIRGYQQIHFRIKAEQICYGTELTKRPS